MSTPDFPAAIPYRLLHSPGATIAPVARARWLTGATLLASDILALSLASGASVVVWHFVNERLDPLFYLRLLPVLGLFVAAYFASGLYPGVALHPVREIRQTSVITTLVLAGLGASTFLTRDGALYSRAVFLLTWLQALVLVPLFRSWAREIGSRYSWWGATAVVLGTSRTAREVITDLQAQPALGLRPVAVLREVGSTVREVAGVPAVGDFENGRTLIKKLGISYGIIATPELPSDRLPTLLRRFGDLCANLVVIPELAGSSSLWVEAADLGGRLGLKIRKNLLLPGPRLMKQIIDLTAVTAGGLLISPVLVVIAALVRLTSPGPIFYGQRRYGRDGLPFTVWKFRSMVQDADKVLRRHLASHPELRFEWARRQKLRSDPRVTRLGRFLRRTSLDELPQLWNVLKGEMSLVGPRPIVRDEVGRYGDDYQLYSKVAPGITGLWQVSGRSDTDYAKRVRLDAYYVSNWSIWLDVYILARTVRAVLATRGAC